MTTPLAFARSRPSPVRVRISSRSNSARPPKTVSIKRPCAVVVSAQDVVDPTIAAHRGRIVKTAGDGMLVELASAVDAVRCAVEVQNGMAKSNMDVPEARRIDFRIGIHVGDIIIDDNDIFGDGVNIAARLEGIADPGGICISDDAHRQIRGKVDIGFSDMGSQTLKNIAEPMRAWRLLMDAGSGTPPAKPSLEVAQPLALPDKP